MAAQAVMKMGNPCCVGVKVLLFYLEIKPVRDASHLVAMP